MTRFSAIALAMLITSACSSLEPQASEPAAEPEITGDPVSESNSRAKTLPSDEGDLICRYEKTIGSRIGTRVCRTQAAEQAAREAAQEALERNAIRTDEDRMVTE